MVDRHAVADEPVDDDVREELPIQVQPPFDEPEAIEYHGLDNLAVGEVVVPRLGDGTADDLSDSEGVEGSGDDSEMADRDVVSSDEISRSGHKRGFLQSTRILWFDNTRGHSN